MQYRSERSPGMMALLILLTLALFAVMGAVIYWIGGVFAVVVTVIDAVLAAMLIWVMLDTWYRFAPDGLMLHSGPMNEKIPYEEIQSVLRTRGFGFRMALAFDRLELNPGLFPERGRIVLSPEQEEEFLAELSRYCPKLKIE